MATNIKSVTAYVNYTQFEGDTQLMNMNVGSGGVPADLTSHTAKIDIKIDNDPATVPLLTLTELDGIVLSNTKPNIVATITADQTRDILGVGEYVYDVQVEDLSGHVDTFFAGDFIIEQSVTQS